MLKNNIIRPSQSEYASPVVLAHKKNGKKRFCIDFKKLNSVTKPKNYPLPLIEDLVSNLNGSAYYSKIDCEAGYWQIALREEHKYLTSFVTNTGQYEFNVMPFGL